MTLSAAITSIGLCLSGVRVADVWADPAVSCTIEVFGGTLSDERDFAGAWPDCRPLHHFTITPVAPGAPMVIRAAGLLRVDAVQDITAPTPRPETTALADCDWCILPLSVTWAGPADVNADGDVGTDADIEAFFACVSGRCCSTCSADFDQDGDSGTDADIDAFFSSFRTNTVPH